MSEGRPPLVAVVTRTRDRPLFLARALESVAAQTFTDVVWVVVNDGGARAPVDAVIAGARARGLAVELIHREASTGMEAASNAGVGASVSEFVVLHDDDDSWDPRFLARMTETLTGWPQRVGVACWTQEVRERLDGATIVETGRRRSADSPAAVSLGLLAARNLFPPIAFLYRRAAYDAAGGYDETLPVLGDWDFNLRLARQSEIGVLPEELARYHVRRDGDHEGANSVTRHKALHAETDLAIRDRYLREDLESGVFGLGALMTMARLQDEQLGRLAASASLPRRLKRWLEPE